MQPEPSEAESASGSGQVAHTLETFFERLRDLCADDGSCHGEDRSACIANQAKHAVALAGEFGTLKQASLGWDAFMAQITDDFKMGSEHVVDFSASSKWVGKLTKPPGFGLVPVVLEFPLVDLRNPQAGGFREAIEFSRATPLEYLARWQANNDYFGDDVHLVSVVQWADGQVSFGITQPQYQGTPAEERDIEAYFLKAGWNRLKDPSGHLVFFNYAIGMMAIDAAKRNCYITDGGLQPFDVILCEPDAKLERFLAIYPG